MSTDQSHNGIFHQLIDDLLIDVGVDPPQALGLWRREVNGLRSLSVEKPTFSSDQRTVFDIHSPMSRPISCRRRSSRRMKLAQQVIQTFNAPVDLAIFRDEYVEGLQKVIEAKIADREVVASSPDLPPAENVMDAAQEPRRRESGQGEAAQGADGPNRRQTSGEGSDAHSERSFITHRQ